MQSQVASWRVCAASSIASAPGVTVRKSALRFSALETIFCVTTSTSPSHNRRLVARGEGGEVGVKDYLINFVNANPEFLPARISGGSGVTSGQKAPPAHTPPVDLDRIKPGMSRDEMERVRQEILRVASQPKGM